MRDPYTILGVPRSASEAEIKKAFRKLAKAHHPDRAADDPVSKEKFAEASTAYEILGDATRRAQFDRGEIGPDGKPRFQGFEGFAGGPGGRPGGFEFQFGGAGPFAGGPGRTQFDPADIFGEMFGRGAEQAGRRRGRAGPPKGEDIETSLAITLAEVAQGGTRRLRLPHGREVEVTLPRAATDGQVMRLKGLGHPSPFGGPAGDLLLTLTWQADPRFTVEGRNLRTRIAVPLADAVLGGPVRVPTLTGDVEMRLPPMTSSGKAFRLRGKGLPAEAGQAEGDLYAAIDIVLPAEDAELTALMKARKGD